MADAAGHKFGQFIGKYCEAALEPILQEFADKHGLYLDKKGPRPARNVEYVQWKNCYGFYHNLDYVLERGGTPEKIGRPVAFIESAWRRYTKHSVNKAAEITGAVVPTAQEHRFSAPMLGCILVGDYSTPPLEQLKKIGFKVLYLNYESVLEAFKTVGIDAWFDEKTPEAVHIERKKQWDALSEEERTKVWRKLIELNEKNLRNFKLRLERAVKRLITAVRIIPLHGTPVEYVTVHEAISFVEDYDEKAAHGPLLKYEILIRYDNGDKIDASFEDRATTIEFLQAYESGNWTPVIDDLNEEVL
ncbi:MAG TPA: hypothetical protein VF590_17625 [Isosphaeraceae bacterium]|jgi:hypothetical protein